MLGALISEAQETRIDILIEEAPSSIRREDTKGFEDARVTLRMFICRRKLPANLPPESEALMVALESLFRRVQNRPSFDVDGKHVGLMFLSAVGAAGHGDSESFPDVKIQIKHMVEKQTFAW